MTTLTASRVATLPRVNLLPPEIAEAAKFRRLQTLLGVAVGATVLLVAGLWVMARSETATAQENLTQAQAQTAQLQAQVNQYANVPQTAAELATAQQQLARAMAPEVRWSFYLNDLSLTIPDGVRLSTLTMSEPLAAALGSGAPPQPTTGVEGGLGIGSIAYTGSATSFDAVAKWLQVQDHEWGVTEPWASTLQDNGSVDTVGDVTQWSSKITVTADALSHRYDKWGN
jgi:Tfp pilus assembly protein PilN